jgi:putative Holliday junction resolvase
VVILGVDFGRRRTGLAFSDREETVALVGPVLTGGRSDDDRIREIAREAEERGAGRIVVGLPKSMDDSSSAMTRRARDFARKLAAAVPMDVVTWDERLTTAQAERAMVGADLSRKKRRKRVDSVAAQIMLQSYLDARRSENMEKGNRDDST